MIDLKNIKPDIRYLKDMKGVVYDKEWLEKADPNLELYYMYRGVDKKDGLRYDITIIPSRMLGQEFVKTKGHNHPVKEVYIVLEGKAIFLVQKSDGNIVEDVYAIKAKKGERINIPVDFYHVVINPYNQELKLGNWISENCQNIYNEVEKMKGACYFYTKSPSTGSGQAPSTKLGASWIKNENYKKIPELRFGESK